MSLVNTLLVVGPMLGLVALVAWRLARPNVPQWSWTRTVVQCICGGRMTEVFLPEVTRVLTDGEFVVFRTQSGDLPIHVGLITPEARAALDTACGVKTAERPNGVVWTLTAPGSHLVFPPMHQAGDVAAMREYHQRQ